MTLDDAFEVVGHDLHTCGLSAALQEESGPYGTGEPYKVIFLEGVPTIGMRESDSSESPSAVLGYVAGRVQDAVLENLQVLPVKNAWPPCAAGHQHPMELVQAPPGHPDAYPWWCCPADRNTACYRVGEHPGTSRTSDERTT